MIYTSSGSIISDFKIYVQDTISDAEAIDRHYSRYCPDRCSAHEFSVADIIRERAYKFSKFVNLMQSPANNSN